MGPCRTPRSDHTQKAGRVVAAQPTVQSLTVQGPPESVKMLAFTAKMYAICRQQGARRKHGEQTSGSLSAKQATHRQEGDRPCTIYSSCQTCRQDGRNSSVTSSYQHTARSSASSAAGARESSSRASWPQSARPAPVCSR